MTLKAIRKFLDYPDAVIFVGSGISRWSGLPSWTGLINQLADYLEELGTDAGLVRREAAAGDLLQAASYGFDKLGPQAIGEFVRKAVQLGVAKPSEAHRALVNLGPSCFITTNYDNLLEQSLSAWRPDEFYRSPITNLHLSELADILSARASHFIFKPHGDASDSASIVLTREQYRVLLPDGERHRTLEALRTLLITRPVFYIGFGLRDPDFLYIKDLLLNTFKGAVREHIAILPNIDDIEIDYWRRNYGIRLFSYDAPRQDDGTEDHSALLQLLNDLQVASDTGRSESEPEPEASASEEKRILALARYTSGLARIAPDVALAETRISFHGLKGGGTHFIRPPYEHWTTMRFLVDGPSQGILIGLPGAGKSYSMKAATASLAKEMQEFLLGDMSGHPPKYLPVYLDLKLFQGDLQSQIDAALPPGFTLQTLRGDVALKIFFDAYNEIPAEYGESGAFLESLESLNDTVGAFDYIISSRTADGLATLGLPTYELAKFDPEYVEKILEEKAVSLQGDFEEDVKRLLARPFFLGLFAAGRVDVTDASRPRDIYESYIRKVDSAWMDRSSSGSGLSYALSRLAFRALEDGREAFPAIWVSDHLASAEFGTGSDHLDALNWLIGQGVLVPYSGARVSFIHQSITEYLAALELVRLKEAGHLSIRDTAALKKWDQCLFLAISLMREDDASEAIAYLVRADLQLALNAVRFAEDGQSALISRMLPIAAERARDDRHELGLPYALSRVPFSDEHLAALEEIANLGGTWGASAVKAIGKVRGLAAKDYVLDLLERYPTDYNFVANGIVEVLGSWVEPSDLERLVGVALTSVSVDGGEDQRPSIGPLLAKFDPDILVEKVFEHAGSEASAKSLAHSVICEAFRDRDDLRSFQILVNLLGDGVRDAIYALYARIRYGEGAKQIDLLGVRHAEIIWSLRHHRFWSSLLGAVAELRPDVREYVKGLADAASGVERIALLSCIDADAAEITSALDELSRKSTELLDHEAFEIFDLNRLNWAGLEAQFSSLVARRLPKLARAVLGGGVPSEIRGLGRLSRQQIAPLLDWISEMPREGDEFWWLGRQIGNVLARHSDEGARAYLLDTLNHGTLSHREAVKFGVITYMHDLNTDALAPEAISLLMSDLGKPGLLSRFFYNPLGAIATERFVEEQLLPLARGADKTLMDNLTIVLAAAGDRHGRRYLLSAQ